MDNKTLNNAVWWIPIKACRDLLRDIYYKIDSLYNNVLNNNNNNLTKDYITIYYHYFEMYNYMINNPEQFQNDINEFKKNLDEDSITVLNEYLHKVKSLVQSKYNSILLYNIPIESNFMSDEHKILFFSVEKIIKEIEKRYIKYDPKDIHISIHVFYYECGLVYVPSNIKERFKNSIAIDGGAFIGDSSIMLLEEYGFSTIHAFEPVDSTFNTFSKTISKYNLNEKIIPHKYGLSNTKSTEYIFSQENWSGSFISDKYPGNEEIKMVSLDDYIGSDKDISLIKLDIEGLEEKALRGAENIIRKFKPVLLISCYHDHVDLGQMFKIKKYIESLNLGYKIIYRALDPFSTMEYNLICYIAEQSRAEQSRAEQSRAEQS
ncbi:FkbM family methyltransferase [Brachyspira pulli]|uniref:FkbM family methyltransferase n=1 Tax=Brachyspira pulli TaxID=310721 RepID=UPI003007033B